MPSMSRHASFIALVASTTMIVYFAILHQSPESRTLQVRSKRQVSESEYDYYIENYESPEYDYNYQISLTTEPDQQTSESIIDEAVTNGFGSTDFDKTTTDTIDAENSGSSSGQTTEPAVGLDSTSTAFDETISPDVSDEFSDLGGSTSTAIPGDAADDYSESYNYDGFDFEAPDYNGEDYDFLDYFGDENYFDYVGDYEDEESISFIEDFINADEFGTPVDLTPDQINLENLQLSPLTEEELDELFPWLVGTESQSGVGVPMDGRRRLSGLTQLEDQLNLENQYSFAPRFGVELQNGNYKVRMDEMWNGVPVYGSRLLAEQERNGFILQDTLEGELVRSIERELTTSTPRIGRGQAISIAKQKHNHTRLLTENENAALFVMKRENKAVLCYLVDYLVMLPAKSEAGTSVTSIRRNKRNVRKLTGKKTRKQKRQRRARKGRRKRNRKHKKMRKNRNQRRRGRNKRLSRLPRRIICSDDFMRCVIVNGEGLTPNTDSITGTRDKRLRERNTVNGGVTPNIDSITGTRDKRLRERRPYTVINANTGRVYDAWDGLTSAFRRVPLIMGNPSSSITTTKQVVEKEGETCTYRSPIGRQIFLTLKDGSTQGPAANTFRCSEGSKPNYDATNGAKSPRNAAWRWTIESLAFLKTLSNNAVNLDKNIDIQVHHSGIHASWNGKSLSFGDGRNRVVYPLTEPDIVAHEVAHIYTERLSGLEYRGQSGGIAESFSDITAVAFLDKLFKKASLKVGETISTSGRPLRDLCNPNSPESIAFNSREPFFETVRDVTTSRYTPHRAAGIYNRAFCQLSKMPKWSIETAFKIFMEANMHYWTPATTFQSGVCGVSRAAEQLIGKSAKYDVESAFASVSAFCSQKVS